MKTSFLARLGFGLAVSLLCAGPAIAQDRADALRAFLRKHYASGDAAADKTTRYSVAFASLNDKTQQIIVYVSGDGWCGSGGCSALILEPANSSFKIRASFTLARLPIRVLPSKTNGWHDLSMPGSGGGVTAHIAKIQFDGMKYSGNPSTAKHLSPELKNSGFALPLNEDGRPLLP